MTFPEHQCGLFLSHNEHRDSYQTVEEWLAEPQHEDVDFPSDEDKAAAIAADDVWELQWYPRTPIGFYRIFASTLDGLLAFAATVQETSK